MFRGGDRGRTGVSSFAGKRVSHSATPPRETVLGVTRREGTEVETEAVLIARDEFMVHLHLDDGVTLSFDAEEWDAA